MYECPLQKKCATLTPKYDHLYREMGIGTKTKTTKAMAVSSSLQSCPVVAADAPLEIGTTVISAYFVARSALVTDENFLCSEMLLSYSVHSCRGTYCEMFH